MNRILSLAAATIAFCLMAPASQAQVSHLKLRFHVPFSFTVNNQTFPAGEYEFGQQSQFLLAISNRKHTISAFETVEPAQSNKEANGKVRLVFHRYDNQYFLAVVSDGPREYTYDFRISTVEEHLEQASPRKPVTIVSVSPSGGVVVARGGK
jgi:hypothetical protein